MTLAHSGEAAATAPMATGSQRDFAANRARGVIGLVVDRSGEASRRRRVHESGSLRVRFPATAPGALEAVLINTAGGMTGGDAFDIRIQVAENAHLVVTSAAAEKIYRSLGPQAAINLTIEIASSGSLLWLPQETILFDGARLARRIEIDLAANARLLFAESLVFGRSGMGETVERGQLHDSWRVRRGGKLAYAEGIRLDDRIAQSLGETATANGGAAIATVLAIPGDDGMTAAIHAIGGEFQGEAGVSAWNGQTVLRFCARDGAALRHDVARAISTLHPAPLPRLWIN
jgi:urease accessory protein